MLAAAFIVLIVISVIESNGAEVRFVKSGKTLTEVFAEWKDYVIQAKDKSVELVSDAAEAIKSIFKPK